MTFVLLRVDYRSTNKIYLQWASLAVAIAASMQDPSVMLSFSPGSLPAMLTSFFLQFAASWVLLCAIIRKARKFKEISERKETSGTGHVFGEYLGKLEPRAIFAN
jgi:hypothetical protein|tara:strand:- start:673 stop:987 length:315 start_codon:yes stop_codon:yes gene_type:complete